MSTIYRNMLCIILYIYHPSFLNKKSIVDHHIDNLCIFGMRLECVQCNVRQAGMSKTL